MVDILTHLAFDRLGFFNPFFLKFHPIAIVFTFSRYGCLRLFCPAESIKRTRSGTISKECH